MMEYNVRSQEDWDLLVSEGRLKYSPDINISGECVLRELPYRVLGYYCVGRR